jgi:hypothetical protein
LPAGDEELEIQPSERMHLIGQTLLRVVSPYITPKQLMKATRKEHPKATKKEIVQAAFYTVIESSATNPEKARALHGLP